MNPGRKTTYTKAIGKFICDKVEEGLSVREICRRFTEFGVPAEKQVYRWKKTNKEFRDALNSAYENFFYQKIDEIEDLSKNLIELQDDERCPQGDFKVVNAWKAERNAKINAMRLRIDTLKFMLAKLAPKLCADLKDTPTTALQVNLPTIKVINYHDAEDGDTKKLE